MVKRIVMSFFVVGLLCFTCNAMDANGGDGEGDSLDDVLKSCKDAFEGLAEGQGKTLELLKKLKSSRKTEYSGGDFEKLLRDSFEGTNVGVCIKDFFYRFKKVKKNL